MRLCYLLALSPFGRVRPTRSRGGVVDDLPVGRFRCRSSSFAPYSWGDRSGRCIDWADRLARPDGLLRPDCRQAFGFEVRSGDSPHFDATSLGQLIPKLAYLISRSEYRPLFQMLRVRGLVVFRDPRNLPKYPITGRVLAAGVIGADKKIGATRRSAARRSAPTRRLELPS